MALLKKFKEPTRDCKSFKVILFSLDNETLELYTDSAGSETMGGFWLFLKRVGVFSVATELDRLRHFKGYYFP
jgi:hypothetical protein